MSITLECIGCRERKEFDIQEKYPVCPRCKEWEAEHHKELERQAITDMTCVLCGIIGSAYDKHHVHGRKNSNVVVTVCCNCHRDIHRGRKSL